MSLSGTGIQDLARRTARGLDAVSEGYPFTDSLLVFKVCGRVFLVVTEVQGIRVGSWNTKPMPWPGRVDSS